MSVVALRVRVVVVCFCNDNITTFYKCDPQEPNETLAERLWGLTEMFPEPVRQVCGSVTELSAKTVKTVYQFSCSASWIFFTSSMILFAPVIFEMERAQMEEMQRSQQKQVRTAAACCV